MGQARPVRLRYTRPALADLAAVLDHIADNSPPGRAAGQATHPGSDRAAAVEPAARSSHGRSHDQAAADDSLSLPDLLRDRHRRDHHPCRAPRRTRSRRAETINLIEQPTPPRTAASQGGRRARRGRRVQRFDGQRGFELPHDPDRRRLLRLLHGRGR